MEVQLDTAMYGLSGIAIAGTLYAMRNVFIPVIAILGGMLMLVILAKYMMSSFGS